MSDEIKVSSKELEELNNAIEESKRKSVASEKDKMEKDIRDKIAAEQRLKDMEVQTAKLHAELDAAKKSREDAEAALKADFTKKIDELTTRQGQVNVQNPFDKKDDKGVNSGINIRDPQVMKDIEEQSRIKYLEKYGKNLPEDFGKRNYD